MTTDTNPPRTTLTDAEAAVEARRIIADFATSYRDHTPTPQYGTAPPVAQPGRPPMSQKAVDVSGVMLAGSVASVPFGGMTCLVLYTLDQVDPLSLTIGACAPIALVLAIGALLRRARGVMPDEHHHHYSGPVYQDQRNTHSRSVWNKTINK
ncbi:hypothetical protein ACIPMW_32385 [Streptomyces sp. NPDC086669]|uniref:hypothetical protein n=1 Tax=Streptomyces sp. NPDC086669 TaxID=3365753 RepID=UPI003813688B